MDNIKQHEMLSKHVKDWVAENIGHLPIGIELWDLRITNSHSKEQETIPRHLSFGKYEASDISVASFYKSHSRIIEL